MTHKRATEVEEGIDSATEQLRCIADLARLYDAAGVNEKLRLICILAGNVTFWITAQWLTRNSPHPLSMQLAHALHANLLTYVAIDEAQATFTLGANADPDVVRDPGLLFEMYVPDFLKDDDAEFTTAGRA